MTVTSPSLVLLARVAEATDWGVLVKRFESDPWVHLERKLLDTEQPLRALKQHALEEAGKVLISDLSSKNVTDKKLLEHKEIFESLLAPGDYADIVFLLDPMVAPDARIDGARHILSSAKLQTLFDLEHPNVPTPAWNKRVVDIAKRMDLERLGIIADRRKPTPKHRARLARRLRRNLREFLSITRGDLGVREELTPFILLRLEAAIAAVLRFLRR